MIKRFFLDDKNILALIVINAIVIFLQGFPADEIGHQALHVLMIIDDVISILFILEVIFKSRHYGWKNYLESPWNKFDVILILMSIPPLVVHLLPIDMSNIGFLLIFRILRVFKFFRFIKFFPEVEHVFRSVQMALKASFSVLVGFILLVFIVSILSCYFYQSLSPEYFGNPIRSFYSTFKVFTVEGWNAIPDDICADEDISPFTHFMTKFYFVVLLFLGGIYGLSIVNSIFVDAMVSDNNEELEEQVGRLETEVKELHQKIDILLEQQTKNKS